MIEYRKGCVVEAFKTGEYIAILHQANCFNTMNSGVAKAIREEFPTAYVADCQTTRADVSKLGGFTYAVIESLAGVVVNLYGQYNYGRDGRKYTQVDYLEKAMERARNSLLKGKNLSVCIPRIGCGLGGADWDRELVPMIERQFISYGIGVHVYDN